MLLTALPEKEGPMADEFAPGDVVRVKSGGPSMTVVEVGDYLGQRKAWCEWFDEKNKPQKETFSVHALEKV